MISLIVVISFSHAYKYAAFSSSDHSNHSTEHLSLTCHPNSISSSSLGLPPPDDPPPDDPHHPLDFLSHLVLEALSSVPLGHVKAHVGISSHLFSFSFQEIFTHVSTQSAFSIVHFLHCSTFVLDTHSRAVAEVSLISSLPLVRTESPSNVFVSNALSW